ncbi:hypothetical protein N7462_009113 [Penicillium macrosclerotiorum]|uniref:uncharacterized protein n=1 Tax=Penicillium macrosclerotiorum TaxID=303699 RepID=UPI0025478C9E|nr:uncharacterized protein N7462_009113 [Penicillium macrosclerotiorum]KAJ5676216.1 hypothetical protein N7462_009113 [Penicillium macrosclerotiorum]
MADQKKPSATKLENRKKAREARISKLENSMSKLESERALLEAELRKEKSQMQAVKSKLESLQMQIDRQQSNIEVFVQMEEMIRDHYSKSRVLELHSLARVTIYSQ